MGNLRLTVWKSPPQNPQKSTRFSVYFRCSSGENTALSPWHGGPEASPRFSPSPKSTVMAITPNWRNSAARLFDVQQSLEEQIQRLGEGEVRSQLNDSQRTARHSLLASQSGDSALAGQRLERILAGNDLADINYLALGLHCARAVGRIVIRRSGQLAGYATGFLAAPGVLVTNEHVFPDAETARDSLLQLNYERTITGEETLPAVFRLQISTPPIISQKLDLAIVAVEPVSQSGQQLREFGWLTLNPTPGKAFIGEYLTIIQHPRGERKQICVRENKLLKYAENEPWVWYQTDTVGGSSGSPVFNTSWDVVALHHQAVPRSIVRGGQTVLLAKNGRLWTPSMGDDAIDWIANEGVRVSSILKFLVERHSSNPLAAAILRNERAPVRELAQPAASSVTAAPATRGITVAHQPDGRTTICVPVEIDLHVNTARLRSEQLTPDFPPQLTQPSVTDIDADKDRFSQTFHSAEAKIDRTNYALRNGYQPDFVGGGLKVPLPKVVGSRFGKPLKLKDGSIEIKYWNYSVVMNPQRRLAFFAAANIRPAAGLGKSTGTEFISDDRVTEVSATAQLDDKFYGKQSTFEVEDRSPNPFDKGHLTRREDLQWGRNLEEAIRNGDDSFHFTNCAPQHFAFNQPRTRNGLWYRLELLATQHLTSASDLCIINGPVFDAPESEIIDGVFKQLRLNGKRHSDRKFGGVQIPKMFFKLVAWQLDRKLFARAFVVSQETLLMEVSRVRESDASPLTPAEIALYELRIADLEKLTGLKFGIPAAAQPRPKEAALSLDQPRRISSEDDLQQVL